MQIAKKKSCKQNSFKPLIPLFIETKQESWEKKNCRSRLTRLSDERNQLSKLVGDQI